MATQYKPIGLTIPFTNSNNGYFQQSFDTTTQIKVNLYNFLNTKRGERRMSPEFGTRLYEELFGQDDNNTNEIIKDIITNEISVWIPQISIKNITISDVKSSVTDNYKKEVKIDFIINMTKENDYIILTIQNILR